MEAPGAVSTGGRAGAMAARVADTARRAGVSEVGVRSIVAALDTAMRPRSERLDDDHHPDYLHPARTVLILLEDAGVVDPATLSAAALTETLRPELAAEVPKGPRAGSHAQPVAEATATSRDRPAREAGAEPDGSGKHADTSLLAPGTLAPGTLDILAEVPCPRTDPDTLLERLVTAPESARLVALAERLDHARHLHLGDRAAWAGLHRETCEIYLPVAERTHDVLARRLRWWCGTFAERFLGTG